uniref:DNA replication/repair protein RecF n=1 Tax=Alistipes sp. TaxID=1872444 RepID=UPI004056EF44
MQLKRLSLVNFKNIAHEELSLHEGINCFVGDNGAGKTNLIDAIYYLSMSKSSLPTTDGQNTLHGNDFFLLEGSYLSDRQKSEQILCSYSRKGVNGSKPGKLIKRNGKEYERLADHVGLIPVVIVSPADSVLISDAAEERRRYLNGFISQLDPDYLRAAMRYNAVLAERNRFLKFSSDEDMLSIYDGQLTREGETIHRLRKHYIKALEPHVEEFYRALSSDREKISLEYRSELNDTPFEELLKRNRERDLINQFTSSGIHRDDLILKIGGYPLRKYGSQGQQKSFLIALKLAQYLLVGREREERPILLLDDLFDKLDAGRVTELLKLVSKEEFGQIFISDCNPLRLSETLDRAGVSYHLFRVKEGAIEQ